MKIINSTDYPDWFLRRLVSWCCRELGMPVRYMKACRFGNSKNAWGGLAYIGSRRIGCRVGRDGHFPTTMRWRGIGKSEVIADRMESLVMVTAHELAHHEQYIRKTRTRRGGLGGSEHLTDHAAVSVLRKFRDQRDSLVAEWETPPQRTEKPTATNQEKNAIKAADALSRWQRKLKLAQTKVRQYRAKVRRYERIGVMAAIGK